MTVAGDGMLLDRRRVELVDEDLPKIPHHSEGQTLPLHEAVALVERVRVSAERHAKLALDAVAMTVPGRILGITLRQCPRAATSYSRAGQGLPGAECRRLGLAHRICTHFDTMRVVNQPVKNGRGLSPSR